MKMKLPLYIFPGDGPPLVGRAWIRALKIPIDEFAINSADSQVGMIRDKENKSIEDIVNSLDAVFSSKLGKYNKGKFKLHLKDDARPLFVRHGHCHTQ